MTEPPIKVTLLELLKLTQIKLNANKRWMDLQDQTISMAINVKKLDFDESLENLEQYQQQLRAMINHNQEIIKENEEDLKFVQEINKRCEL